MVNCMERLRDPRTRPSRLRRGHLRVEPALGVGDGPPKTPVLSARGLCAAMAALKMSRRDLRERSGLSLPTITALRSGRVTPTPAVLFRLALAIPQEFHREVFGGQPQDQGQAPRRGYDRSKDRLLRALDPLEVGDGRIVRAGVFSYDGGKPTLRVHVEIGGRSVLIARVAIQDSALAAHLIGLIADVAFPAEPANEPMQGVEVSR